MSIPIARHQNRPRRLARTVIQLQNDDELISLRLGGFHGNMAANATPGRDLVGAGRDHLAQPVDRAGGDKAAIGLAQTLIPQLRRLQLRIWEGQRCRGMGV